jgi:Ca2+-binding RTX toxin-like protein
VRSEAVLAPSNAIVADASVTAGNKLGGGTGNDVFVLAGANDRANGGNGIDTVLSAGGVNLNSKRFSSIENATLLGTDDLALVGSKSANQLTGNLGDNRLDGGRGNDTLTGGAGEDLFFLRKGSVDTITDFARGEDKLVLFERDFKALADFGLEADDFSTFFTYNATTGAFSVDTNGERSGGVVQIAIIGNRPDALDASDLLIV